MLSYKNGLPTSLARTGEQWDLPNAWPPLQHMVIAGKDVAVLIPSLQDRKPIGEFAVWYQTSRLF